MGPGGGAAHPDPLLQIQTPRLSVSLTSNKADYKMKVDVAVHFQWSQYELITL